MGITRRRWLAAVAAIVLCFGIGSPAGAHDGDGRGDDATWVGTWAASPQLASAPAQFDGQTLRQIMHTSIGGESVRVRLSNAFGTDSLVIGAAHVALRTSGASIRPSTDRPLTFNGAASITIPPVGDFTGAPMIAAATTPQSWFFLAGVEVNASRNARAVVTLGDSITDGYASTPDANRRWPNRLAERLQAAPGRFRIAVLDEGISGNRVLHDFIGPNALARLDRDVLVQSGVRYVIVLEGINDIGIPGAFGLGTQAVTADQIIAGHRQIIDRAHALGLKVIGGTLTPFEGTVFPGYFSAAGEAKRQAVNQWIRNSRAYDAVIDFDAVTRDRSHRARLLPAYDSGDHLHPNDAGYRAMGDAVNLNLFRDDD